MTVNSLLALTRRLRAEKFEWDVLSKRLKSFTGEYGASGSMLNAHFEVIPGLGESGWKIWVGSVEQAAEKFEWGVLCKWLKSFTGENGAIGYAVKFVWMGASGYMQWATLFNTVRNCTTLYNTVQHCTTPYNSLQMCTIVYNSVQ